VKTNQAISNFDKLILLQMLIYWVIAPLLSIITGEAKYSIIYIIPYFITFLVYAIATQGKDYGEIEGTFKTTISNQKILFIIVFLIIYMELTEDIGRLPFGEAQKRNASFDLYKAILFKICEIGFPLFFSLQVNQKKIKLLNLIIMMLCIVGSFIYSGASKSILLIYFFLFIIFSVNLKITPKLFFASSFLILISFMIIFILRGEQTSIIDIIKYLINRLDGIALVSEDNLNQINLFNIPNLNYIYPYLFSVYRFIDIDVLDIFSSGLISIKSIYLFNSGYAELDTTISFPSELIILLGYIPGLIISTTLLLILRAYGFNKIFSSGTIRFSIGYSIIISIIMVESSSISYILNPVKIFPIVYILMLLITRIRLIKKNES
jgi:hypothetical protein